MPSGRSIREKRNFVLRPRTTSPSSRQLCQITTRFQPAARVHSEYVGIIAAGMPSPDAAAESLRSSRLRAPPPACTHTPPPRCQKTRWHLKERSQGQEASLRLPSLGPTDDSSPHPLLIHPPLPPAGCSLLHRLRLPFSIPPTSPFSPHQRRARDHPSAAAASLRSFVLCPAGRESCRPVRE